ncbi:hypothetical protein ABZ260_13485 [Streptosporangium sp. NPDC006013]|uniref:hypothetical protein n=1 Tax=Streptosporangium sp. NPDC006013 TaxID=3155596 RepID=UPI0033BC5601
MATEDADKPAGHEPVESLIDDLIRDIFSEAGQSTKTRVLGGDSMATLIETVIASAPRTMPMASIVERLLVTQALASALADALAPALAEALAPEIMKALENYPTGERASGEMTPAGRQAQPRAGRRKA